MHVQLWDEVTADRTDHCRKASASSKVGCPSVPPAHCVDNAPQTQASRSDFSSDHPFRYPYRKPESKLSPAPTVSTTWTGTEATRALYLLRTPSAPWLPNLIPRVSTFRPSRSAAVSRSASSESDNTSLWFGRNTFVTDKSSSKPVHDSDGS